MILDSLEHPDAARTDTRNAETTRGDILQEEPRPEHPRCMNVNRDFWLTKCYTDSSDVYLVSHFRYDSSSDLGYLVVHEIKSITRLFSSKLHRPKNSPSFLSRRSPRDGN